MRNLLHRSLMSNYTSSISKEYFTIVALESGLTVKLSNNASSYRIDDGRWTSLSAGTATPSVNAGQKIQFRITNPTISYSVGIGTFTVNKSFNVEGNIMSLLYGDNFANQQSLTGKQYAFTGLFKNCTTLINAKDLILPATTLANNCYQNMFYNCYSLTSAPSLPATTLANFCYHGMFSGCRGLKTAPSLSATTLANFCYCGMFQGCTGLKSAPSLPATTLAEYCYSGMFDGCTGLTSAPSLPVTTLTFGCYNSMFSGCTGLKSAPSLPATTLYENCYYAMFSGCTGLTSAPTLPATTLAEYCYGGMFSGCTGLTSAPALPVTTLAEYCYSYMFDGCTGLTSAPSLPAKTLADSCYRNMFDDCTGLTSAPALPATTLYENCYYGMFDGCTGLTSAPALPATTLVEKCYSYMFKGCSKLNYIKMLATNISASNCLSNWVSGVASTGTFVKHSDMNSLPTGVNGIPTGWTVLNNEYYSHFTIEALENGLTVSLSQTASQYRIGSGSWTNLSAGSKTSSVNAGQKIQFRITNPTISSSLGIGTFTVNKKFNVSGNIMSLLYGDNFTNQQNLTGKDYAFEKLFYDCVTLQSAKKLILPAKTLADCCYENMFNGCMNLTIAPTLYGTTLADSCYEGMFQGCVSLTTAPSLSVTTLADSCYENMFSGCTSLTTAPTLPATTLYENCYYGMFNGCTGLTSAPSLPATTLADFCYNKMFQDCTGLKSAPTLPATTLKSYCYGSMFSGCTGLTSAPSLPATTLTLGCYSFMFSGCTGLKSAPSLPATTLYTLCYSNMFNGCTGLTSAPSLSATTLSSNCYASMFSGCTGLKSAPSLPATTLTLGCYSGMFNGCTGLTSAPSLPATTLEKNCYRNMFYGCTGLTSAPALPATTLAEYCYDSMFRDCTGLKTAPTLSSTKLANYCYQYMFRGCTGLTSAPVLPATTLNPYCYRGMFYGCSKINYIKMSAINNIYSNSNLSEWLSGVSSTGKFVKNICALTKSFNRNESGIPKGWTIVEECVTPSIINISKKPISLDHNNGVYTPTSTNVNLSGQYTNEVLLSMIPMCNIHINIVNKDGSTLQENILWENTISLESLLNYCGMAHINVSDIAIVIIDVDLPNGEDYYYDDVADVDYSKEYFTIESLEDENTIYLNIGIENQPFSYRIDKGAWVNITSSTNRDIEVDSGQKVQFKINDNRCGYGDWYFMVDKAHNMEGNIMSLLYGDNFVGKKDLSNINEDMFYEVFTTAGLKSVENLILPATTLVPYCYTGLFRGCNTLTTAPKILPATTLAEGCYSEMFLGCTSLTTAPELPATTLAVECYSGMFMDCQSLLIAPELPATTLTSLCYYQMFYNCYMLDNIKMNATNISAEDCLREWVVNVAPVGNFIKNPNMEDLEIDSVDGIPAGWSVCDTYYKYFTIKALTSDFSVGFITSEYQTGTLEYSLDGGNVWKPLIASGIDSNETQPKISAGSTISFRGNLISVKQPSIVYNEYGLYGIGIFDIQKSCSLHGNIMSLMYKDDDFSRIRSVDKYSFCELFKYCKGVNDARELYLPATTLDEKCYMNMFIGCTSLTSAPTLPATTLANECYSYMFSNCSLNNFVPSTLPATTLSDNCYLGMFSGCTGLTSTPKLPATTLANNCYENMFRNCSSLNVAPELPATTLTPYCYKSMFRKCTSLKSTPVLVANTLTTQCYFDMFCECSSLNKATIRASNNVNDTNLYHWLYGVSATGVVHRNKYVNFPSGPSGIPNGWK